jgi:hypothetical protein
MVGQVGFRLAPDPGLGGALCAAVTPELFFSEPGDLATVRVAKEICAACPVRVACLTSALAAEGTGWGGRYGIWGGLTPEERQELARPVRRVSRCGTRSGYRRHLRDGEPACDACRDANRKKARHNVLRKEAA